MICDVHFGDTRNDITPAKRKWLPNNYPEEQTTTTTSCYYFTLYLPVEESPNTHLQSHSISALSPPLFSPLTHTFDDAGKEGRKEAEVFAKSLRC